MEAWNECVFGMIRLVGGVVRWVVVDVVQAPRLTRYAAISQHLLPYLAPAVVIATLERWLTGALGFALRTQRTAPDIGAATEFADVRAADRWHRTPYRQDKHGFS